MNNTTHKKTPEEISAIRRAANLKRKTFGAGPGRPKGKDQDGPRMRLWMLVDSHEVIKTCARIDKTTSIKFIKRLTDQLKLHPRYAAAFHE